MRLAKLTVQGFKSFADRTEFAFDDAITGIVGPNGCGKSNVVDAIRWVLGERSSKSLRGKEMIDVIFAGSSGRKPSGMASVTLCFENPHVELPAAAPEAAPAPVQDAAPDPTALAAADADPSEAESLFDRGGGRRRALPIDADTVEVERRLYRDGESQYLINGRRARLRDIRDLFLDTGIGADAYSIIEQGKVDSMLLASPLERRTIFEEAAGIAKYKARRVEAERKLERASANLELTRQQLATTERRLRTVAAQADKARRFIALDRDLKATRAAIAFDEYDDLVGRLEGLTSRLADLEVVRARTAALLDDREQARQRADLARHELSAQLRAADDQRVGLEHEARGARQRAEFGAAALAEARRQAEADEARARELDDLAASVAASIAAQASAAAELDQRLADLERTAAEAAAERSARLAGLAGGRADLASLRATVARIDRDRAALVASIDAEHRRGDQLRQQAESAAVRATELDSLLAAARTHAVLSARAVVGRRESCAALDAQLHAAETDTARLAEARRSLADDQTDLEQRWLRADARRQTLEDLEQSRAGLGDGARHALAERDAGRGFASVVCTAADLIEADAESAPIVEAALGTALEALVIPSITAAPSAAELATLPGRATFLPAAGLSTPGPGAAALAGLAGTGRVTPLRDLVRRRDGALPPAAADGLLDRLTASTVVTDTLDAALLLAAGPLAGWRFVTRRGEVLDADGRLTAGSPASGSAGLLQRRGELDHLRSTLAALAGEAEAGRARLEAADAEAARLTARAATTRASLAADQRALVADQAAADRADADLARLTRDAAEHADQRDQLTARAAAAEAEESSLRERAASLSRLFDEQAGVARDREAELERLQAEADAAADRAAAARVDAGRVGEQLAGVRREARRLESAADDALRRRRDLAGELESAGRRIRDHETDIARALELADRCAGDAATAAARADAARAALAAADHEARSLADQAVAARDQAQRVERDWHSLEVARREVEVKREALEDRVGDELSIDLRADHPEYRAMMASGGVARIDPAAAAAEADELRAAIAALGSVNLDAVEEETQLAARNDDLARQVADIDAARARLEELVATLNEASRTRFAETFAAVQEHFAGPAGLFRKLFGGGKAEIRLMPVVRDVDGRRVETDEIDLLESGVEIIAKPPGKEPRAISQLSGGEKTLTAVAMLLAIFRSKPSCFCVLDEVDAALDDANVGRYCSVMREFTAASHFIVITHNKRTMRAADRLFGVTMQERGVSTRVSVRLDDYAESIEPAPSGHDAPAAATPADDTDTAASDSDRPEPLLAAAPSRASNLLTAATRPSGALRAALAGARREQERIGG